MTGRGRALFIALNIAACAGQVSLTRVVVVDRGDVLRTISDPPTLQAFERMWRSREEAELPGPANWTYKLTIGSGEESNIWLYDPAGYAQLLAVKNTPTYRMPDHTSFNALLGVPNRPLQPTRAAQPNGKREPAGSGPRG